MRKFCIFSNQLLQFYSNNATNLRHLTTHNRRTCWPTKWRSYCDHTYVRSFHPTYTRINIIIHASLSHFQFIHIFLLEPVSLAFSIMLQTHEKMIAKTVHNALTLDVDNVCDSELHQRDNWKCRIGKCSTGRWKSNVRTGKCRTGFGRTRLYIVTSNE